MITLRPAAERGHADFGWLDSRHSFSFGSYSDPEHMGFGHLRVINEDRVAPGAGFGPHSHRDMEIVSYVVEGRLAHRDSTGSAGIITPGEVQVMSAGSGIRHSEMNGSDTEGVHFLQIWLLPARTGTAPGYRQARFEPADGLTLLVSPGGREGSLSIGQDVDLYRASLPEGGSTRLELRGSRAWIQVIEGVIELEGARLSAGDGAAVEQHTAIELQALSRAEALLFDLQ